MIYNYIRVELDTYFTGVPQGSKVKLNYKGNRHKADYIKMSVVGLSKPTIDILPIFLQDKPKKEGRTLWVDDYWNQVTLIVQDMCKIHKLNLELIDDNARK